MDRIVSQSKYNRKQHKDFYTFHLLRKSGTIKFLAVIIVLMLFVAITSTFDKDFKIKEETSYNEQTESVQSIYNKISEEEDFTISGYTVTITDKKEVANEEEEKLETQKIKEYIYILDKDILQGAVNEVVKSFVDEKEYEEYI